MTRRASRSSNATTLSCVWDVRTGSRWPSFAGYNKRLTTAKTSPMASSRCIANGVLEAMVRVLLQELRGPRSVQSQHTP